MTLRSFLSNLFGFDPKQPRVGKLSVRQWLWIFIGFSVALQVFISILSALEFRQGAYDLGLSMQAFSNTGNGRFFWATGPYLKHGTISILDNHFSWVYFAVYPIYSVIPGQTTLFVIQAVPIALAAIPLAALTAEASDSPRKGLLVGGLYLLWAPMYAGMPGSFHLESFLPVLFFSLVLVWYRKQYALGLVLAVVAGFTLDAAPILTALVAVMFLTYPLQAAIRMLRSSPPANPAQSSGGSASRISAARRRVARVTAAFIRLPAVQAGFGLIIVSVAVFFSIRYLEANLLGWLGYHGSSLGVFRNLGTLSVFSSNWETKVVFWLVMLATVGFLPLLYPRILIVLVPWIVYTFIQTEGGTAWYSIPSHYVAIAAVPLFIGTALGIGALPLSFHSGSASSTGDSTQNPSGDEPTAFGAPSPAESRMGGSDPASGQRGGNGRAITESSNGRAVNPVPTWRRYGTGRTTPPRWMYVGSILLIVGVFAANVGLNPLNPVTAPMIAAARNGLFMGDGGPYSLTLTPQPGYDAMVQLVGQIPAHASLLVETPFYPLVSTDPNAYPPNGLSPPFNPFSDANLPNYILSSRGGLAEFKTYVTNISTMVWNTSFYGVKGWVQSTRVGSIFLFERGYTGPTKNFGPISYPQIYFGTASTAKTSALKPATAGHLAKVGGVWVIRSVGNRTVQRTGEMWAAFDTTQSLPAGKYKLVVGIRVGGNSTECGAASTNNSALLAITGSDESTKPTSPAYVALFNKSISYNQVSCKGWRNVPVQFTLMHPVAAINLYGVRWSAPIWLRIFVFSVELLPA